MHYYIDGYNLMFRVLKAEDNLSVQREKIINELNKKIQLLGLEVTLVFDAQYQFDDTHRTHYKNVELLFTAEGETADDYILYELKVAKHPSEIIVVTSDKKLAWLARRKQARTESVEEFYSWLNKRYKNKLRRLKEAALAPKLIKPPKKAVPEIPLSPKSPEECFNYYLEQFEERFMELAKKTPKPVEDKHKPKDASYKKVTRPPKKAKDDARSDMERWLEAFEQDSQ